MHVQNTLQKIVTRYELLTKKLCNTEIIGSKDFITFSKEQKKLLPRSIPNALSHMKANYYSHVL